MSIIDVFYRILKVVIYLAIALTLLYISLLSFSPVIGAFALKWHYTLLPEVWTLDNFKFIFSDPFIIRSLESSVLVAFTTSLSSLVIYLLVILFMHYKEQRGWINTLFEIVVIIPLMIPAILLALSMYELYRPTAIGGTFLILVFAHITIVSPYVYRNLYSVSKIIDMKSLIEASRSLGAGLFTTLFKVILPNIYHGLLGAFLLSFAISFGDFEIANILAPWQYRTVTIAIFQYSFKNIWIASAIISIVIFVSVTATFSVAYISRKAIAKYTEVTR
jgi:putative spermidine/putrescine transport system permease protein